MNPPKDYADYTLDGNKVLAPLDKALLGAALQKLLSKSRLALHDHPKGGRCLRFVSEEQAQQQLERFGGLTTNELLVYQKIEETKTKGLFQRDLKARTGITNPNMIKAIIDKLMKRRLIKDFTSVHTGKKKMYILAELEPAVELTGGSWYTGGELDVDLVEACTKLALHFFGLRKGKGARVSEVGDFIKSKGVLNCDLSMDEVLQLVETLFYDGKIERYPPHYLGLPAGERGFRVANQPSVTHDHYSQLPCATCPIAHAGHPPEPSLCPYWDYWLSVGTKH